MKPKLLLFDDDRKTVDITQDELAEEFEVTLVSEEEGLDDVITDQYAVIVTDVSIIGSDKTGYQIIDGLRRKHRITRTPIVVYSAKVRISDIEDQNKDLFYKYVNKVPRENEDDELLATCIEASKEDKHLISWKTFTAYFGMQGILDDELDSAGLSKLTPIIEISALKTNRQLLEQILEPDLEGYIWDALEDLAWSIYCRSLPPA